MRVFLVVLVLFFSFQPLTNADDVTNFEIDGMTIGDSLLEFYTLEEIELELQNSIYYPKSKKMKVIGFKATNSELYIKYDFHIKNNDKKFIIYSIKGLVKLSIDECIDKKNDVISQIEKEIPNSIRDNYTNNYNNSYGNSLAHINDFKFVSGDIIRVWCMEWDHNNNKVKSHGWWDGLAVNISSKEQIKFIQNEAY